MRECRFAYHNRMIEADVRSPERDSGERKNIVFAVVGVLLVFIGFLAWAVASPIGGSPDDDYHLSSIWCPRPIEGTGCEVVIEDGVVTEVFVPESISRSVGCWNFDPSVSAACDNHLSDDVLASTDRFNMGSYPFGFYEFQHLFVGPDVQRSIVSMRIINVLFGLFGLAIGGVLLDPQKRYHLLVASIAAWVPMGVYFIASNNPSSWAISGTLIYTIGLFGALDEAARNRWASLAVATFGAAMAATSRTDAAFYLLVITLAVWVLFPVTRARLLPFAWSGLLVAFGLFQFLSAGHTGNLSGSGGWPVDVHRSTLQVFHENLLTFPDYFAAMWGLGQGPGWLDVPLRPWSTITMLLVVGGILFAGGKWVSLRKGLAAIVVAGAIVGVPTLGMALRHVHPVAYYQGRYVLPLVAVLLFIWLMRPDNRIFVGAPAQIVTLIGVAGLANALALQRLITRFSLGIDSGVQPGSPEFYWWPWAFSPQTLSSVGGTAMIAGITLLLIAARRAAQVQEQTLTLSIHQ